MKIIKKSFMFFGLALSLGLLASCNNNSNEEGKYVVKDINIYRKKEAIDKKIGLRFYNDNPNVPYVGVKEYFKEFYNTDFTFDKDSNTYVFKKANKEYIKLNTKDDILEVVGLDELSIHPDFKSNTNKNFFQIDKKEKSKGQFKIVDLKNYDILTYSGEKDAYLPIGLLGCLYGGVEGYNVNYNGKDLYVFDLSGELSNGVTRDDEYYSDTYYTVLSSKDDRYEDLAKYNYNQLCFTFDNLRGYTTQLVFGDFNLQSIGLNGILETYYPDIKELLLSKKRSDYDKGIMLLFGGLYDGGHTGLLSKNPPVFSYYQELKDDPKFKDLVAKFMGRDEIKIKNREAYSNMKVITLGIDYSTYKFGYYYDSTYKTAFIHFDKFVVDNEKWDKYYKGDKDILKELEKGMDDCFDTYAYVRNSFYKAKSDGATNVVLDFTTNGGGYVEAVMGVLGLINKGKATHTATNIVDKSRYTDNYSIDINLDGKFDEADVEEAKKFDFKIVGLTSPVAFSSGNYLPAIMKSLGYKIIGDKSGGGNCALIKEATSDGYIYSRSGYLAVSDSLGNNIDSGVSVDYNLVSYKADGSLDLSKVYDVKTISEYMNKL